VLVAGRDPLTDKFTLDFTTASGTGTTGPLPIDATAAQVQAALVNALLTADGEVATVTKSGNTFTIVFGNALSDEISLTATPSGGAEVQVVDGQISLSNVAADNTWRGAVTLNAGTRLRTPNDSRLALLGNISDTTVSHLVKRGNGALLLGGANTYRGVTLVSEGITTIMNDRALGFGDSTEASGTIVRTNAQLQIQGNLTVANESLIVGGSGPDAASVPDAIPVRWLQVGGAPINNGQTPGNTPVTGRVTGIAVDPTDSQVMYIATAGGGAWKTKDGGKTWVPLFDLAAPTIPTHGGAIVIDPADPRILYYGTGESNNTTDSFAGNGVYRSTDSGRTWTRLLDTTGALANPLAGQSVSKMILSGGFVYAATSDSQNNAFSAAPPGVWRYSLAGQAWVNLTAGTSTVRATQKGGFATPPNTPGPDDDFRIRFPQTGVSWTDIAMVGGTLYAALMENPGTSNGGYNSGVYRMTNPALNLATTRPIWLAGDGATDSRNGVFPAGPLDANGNPTGPARNGRISLAASGGNVWAVIARPTLGNATDGQLLEIQRSTNGGQSWAALSIPGAMANVLGTGGQGQGNFSNTILAVNSQTLYVGGSSASHIWTSSNAGGTWTDISVSGTTGPYAGNHAMAATSGSANAQLILGGDGGVYRYSPTGSTWEDLNGTLAISLYSDIAVSPTDYNVAAAGTQGAGTAMFNGSAAWTMTDGEHGGDIYFDPKTPTTLYHVQHADERPNSGAPVTLIRKSVNGGQTWSTVYTTNTPNNVPLALDQINPQRLVLSSGNSILESLNGLSSAPVSLLNGTFQFIGLGAYQGQWVDDPAFASINDFDRGANTYDPSTIYVSDGTSVTLTKDNGLSWVTRNIGVTHDTYTLDFNSGVLKYKDAPLQVTFSNVTPGAYVTARTVRDGVGSLAPFARQVDEQQTLDVIYPNGMTGTFDLTVSIAATGTPYNTAAKSFTLTNIPLGISGAALAALINPQLQPQIRGDEYQALVFSGAGGTFTLTVGATTTGSITNSGVNATTVNAINTAFATAGIIGVTAELHGAGINAAIYLHYTGSPNTNVPLAGATGSSVDVFVREVQQGGNGTVSVTRSVGAAPQITSFTVDPANHDTVYITAKYPNHINGPSVFRTTDAARTWTDISGTGLPTIVLNGTAATTVQPVWSLALDPRDGTLYVGTDVGVYASRDVGATWAKVGDGMPNVAVRDLELNLSLNTLSAGTYGRSMYQLFLDRARADSGALRTVSGNSTWTGPVRLTGPTRIETDGTQDIQNGIAASSLNIIGTITDSLSPTVATTTQGSATASEVQTVTSYDSNGTFTLSFTNGASTDTTAPLAANATDADVQTALNALSTIGGVGGTVVVTSTPFGATGTRYTITFGGTLSNTNVPELVSDGDFDIYKEGEGTLIFSGKNTYGGVTEVRNGVLEIRNPEALGDSDAASNTIVFDGAALQLATDLYREPIVLNGSGYSFSGHFGGSLRNVSGVNTYTGELTLNTPTVTIGVDSGTQLTIGDEDGDVGDTDNTGVGTVIDSGFTSFLVKELTGTLVLANANSYTGTTNVVQGALRVEHADALGSSINGTYVFDGAALEISRNNVTRDSTVIAAEPLFLSGTGIFGTGSFRNVRGDGLPDTGGKNNNNTWRGPIEMREINNFSPSTDAPREVTYGTTDIRDTLTIDTSIQEENPGYVVNKVGPGRLTFVQDNQYTGQTNVVAGYLRVMTVGGLGVVGPGEPGTIVSNGATLELDGTLAALDMQEDLLLFGDGVGNVGALNNVAFDNRYSAPITIGSTSAGAGIGAVAGTELTIIGLLQDPVQLATPIENPAPGRLRKLGNGTVVLPNAKTYSGQTLVSQGVLTIRDPNALGTPRSEVQFIQVTATTGSYALEFNGATTAPILFNAVDTDIKAALEALSTIGGVGGTVDVTTIPGAGITTFQITFGGTLQNSEQPEVVPIYIAPTITTIQNGTAALPEIQDVIVNVPGGAGNFGLVFNGARTVAIPVNATANQVRDALWALPTIGTGNVTVTRSGTVDNYTYRVIFAGTMATGNRNPIQSAIVGGTIVTAGTNMDGQRGTTVASGATLLIDAAMTFNFPNTGEIITLNGQGFDPGTGPLGALHIANGDVTFDSPLPILLGSDASVGVGRAGDTLYIESVISDVGGAHDLDIYGPGTVRYDGDGTGSYNGSNYKGYTGTTTVNSGTLLLNVTAAPGVNGAILGPLVVGNSPVADGNALVRALQDNQVADTSTVRVNADGAFDLNGFTDTISDLTVVGGDVYTRNGGKLTTGKITMTAGAEIFVGNNAVLTGGVTSMTNSDIHVGTNSTVTLGDLTMNASDIDFAPPGPGTLNVGNVTMSNGSTITLPGGPLTINAIDLLLNNSTIDLNNNSSITVRNVTLQNNALIDFDNTGKFIATGAVSVANSRVSFDTDGRFNITGNLTLTDGVVELGNATAPNTTPPTTATLSAAQISMTGAASRISVGNNGYLTASSKVTNSAGDILLGSNAKFAAGGNVTLSADALVSFGTGGSFNNQPFDLILDNSDFTMASGGTAKTRNIALTADALIQFANAGTLESTGNTTMSGASDITFLAGGTATTGNLDINTGTISFQDNGTLNTANVTDTAAEISFGNGGKFNAGAVSVLNGSVRFGNVPSATYPYVAGGTFGAFNATGALSLDGSTFSMGDGSQAAMAGFSLANASKALFNNDVTVTDNGTLTLADASEVRFGETGKLVTGNLTQNGGAISFRNNGTLDPATVTESGGTVTFLDNGTFTPDGVTATNAFFTFGNGAVINASGNVILNQTELKTLTNANVDVYDLTTIGNAKITIGDNSTVDAKAVSVTGTGGSLAFGNNVIVTGVGNFTMANGTGTWGTSGQLNVTGNASLSNSTLGFDTGGTVRVQGATANVDLVSASQINFAGGGTLRADGDLTMKTASKLSYGPSGTLDVNDLSITTGSITMGTAAKLLATGTVNILGAAVNLGTNSLFDATGDVLVSISGASPASLVIGAGGTVETNKLTVATATVNIGANSVVTTAGDVNVFVLTTGSSKVIAGDNVNFNVNGNVTSTNGTWTFGNTDKLAITGAATLTNGSMTFGSGGKLLAGGDLTLNNSPVTFSISGGTVTAEDVFVHNKSKITFSNGGTLTATGPLANNRGTIEVLGSSQLRFGTAGGAFTGGTTTVTDSSVTGGTNIAINLGSTTIDPSTFTFGDGSGGSFNGDVIVDQSTYSFGNNANVTVTGTFTTDNSNIAFGNNGNLAITGNAKLDHGIANLGDNFAFSASDTLLTGINFSQGNIGGFTTRDLTLTDALLNLGASITGSVRALGVFNSTAILGVGTNFAISGDIAADSSPLGTNASILGGGRIDLGTATHGIAVGNADAIDGVDFGIYTDIASSATARLVKTGPGRLELSPPNPAVVDLTITAGDVQVTGGVGDVQLAGGKLSGNGSAQFLNGPSGPAVGYVIPGDNWDVAKSGILTVSGAVWGPNTIFNVDLAGSVPGGSPQPGTNYDQLVVTGDIELGNAQLTANYGPNILLNDSFTIVNATGTVTGKFQQFNNQDILFVSGQKFQIEYTQHTVVLNKVRANATVSMTSAPNPSTLNQPVTLTATLVPEPGAILFSGQMTVTFYDNGNAIASPFVNEVTPGNFRAVYTFTSLSVGSHTLTARFNGDADNFNPSTTQPPQVVQVVEQPYADPLVGGPSFLSPNNPSSPGVQDTYSFSTTVRDERGTIDWRIDITDSSNAIVRTINGSGSPDVNNRIAIATTWDGKSDASVFVADGAYTATFSVNPDQFGNVFTATPVTITVDNTSPLASLNTPNPVAIDPTGTSVLQPATVISGSVSDTNLSGWTVSIRNGSGGLLRSYSGTGPSVNVTWNGKYDPLDATDPVNPTVTAPDAAYTVTVTAFDAAGNTTTSSGQTVVVLANGPAVTLTSNSPTVYGQNFTLTATVTLPTGSPPGLVSLLSGDTVQFFRGASLIGSGTLSFNAGLGVYQATSLQPTLNAGTYNDFTAVYVQSADFPRGVSSQATHTITPAPLTVTANNKTRTYGAANPTLTYTASGFVNGDTAATVLGGVLFTPATVTTGVGTYPIQQGTLAPNGNYTISTFNNGTLTITPAGLTLQIDNKTRPVRTPNPAFTFTVIGLLNGDPASVVSSLPMGTAATITSPVGSYAINATGAPVVGPNYTVSNIIPGTLEITPVLTNFAVGAGASLNPTQPSLVNVYSPTGTLIRSFTPFGSFAGGIRTAVADFTGDGVQDVAVTTGPGAVVQVSVFDGVTGGAVLNVFPFEPPVGSPSSQQFTGGAFVAAGDIDSDGVAELVITPDQGGGPRVVAYKGGTFAPFISYFGINDPNFRGGARAAVGDINNDGYAEVVVSAGFEGGPRISIWDGKALTSAQFQNVVPDFFAFEETLRNGAYVAVGDVNGDGYGDLIAGAGPGGGPRVNIFSGKSLMGPLGTESTVPFSFFAGNPDNRGGVRVAAKVFDNDLFVDVLTGAGDLGGDTTTAYLGKDLKNGTVDDYFSLDFPGVNNNGVFVG
jgi:autotransporter-associated beta strand protein